MFPETWSCCSEEGIISESVICYNFHVVGGGDVATSTLIPQGCSVIWVITDSAILDLNIIWNANFYQFSIYYFSLKFIRSTSSLAQQKWAPLSLTCCYEKPYRPGGNFKDIKINRGSDRMTDKQMKDPEHKQLWKVHLRF